MEQLAKKDGREREPCLREGKHGAVQESGDGEREKERERESEKEKGCISGGGGDGGDGYTDNLRARDCMLDTDTVQAVHGRQRGGSAHQTAWDPRHGRALSTSAHRPILTASSRVFTAAAQVGRDE